MAAYCNALNGKIAIEKFDQGVYYVGQRKVHFMLKRDDLFMRRGAGVQGAHAFLDSVYKKTLPQSND